PMSIERVVRLWKHLLIFVIIGYVSATLSHAAFNSMQYQVFQVAIAQNMEQVWQVNETIELSSGMVEWTEIRHNPQPHHLIEDGLWFEYHIREYLSDSGDLFLVLDDTFNWTAVNAELFDPSFYDWTEFADYIYNDTIWWLEWSWGFDSLRFGISADDTFIDAELYEDKAFVSMTCHVTNVPEYLISWELGVGELGGGSIFDLRSISLGRLESYEYFLDYTNETRLIHIHFLAPSNILQETGEVSTATIYLNRRALEQQEYISNENWNIVVVMPSATEVVETTGTPSQIDNNLAIFTVQQGERLPVSFTVKSMPPQETMFDVLANPEVLAAIITVLIVFPSGLQGIRMFSRRRTYNRLLTLLVKLYREHKSNPETLKKEMDNLTETIFMSFVQNNVTDEQLERLLHRKDDLLSRL
ncbi:MAG: hypothetical protein JSV85_00785, partial [Candidatus Bathyarchaeota archaeon]